jgi:hypothetical protein
MNAGIMRDYVGFNFYCSSDQFISIVIGQILHVPAQWSIYVRERSSRMYSPSAYFFATWMATTLNYLIFQPLIYASLSFLYVDFKDTSLANYLDWLLVLTIQGIIGSTFGFMFGTMFSDELISIMICY